MAAKRTKVRLPLDFDPGNDLSQPEPTPMFDVFAAVQADLKQRDAIGWKQHGMPLDARVGRDWIQEAYEEALDMAVYLKAALLGRGRA